MIHKNKYALTLMDVTTVDSNADADVADIGDSNDNDRDTGYTEFVRQNRP